MYETKGERKIFKLKFNKLVENREERGFNVISFEEDQKALERVSIKDYTNPNQN